MPDLRKPNPSTSPSTPTAWWEWPFVIVVIAFFLVVRLVRETARRLVGLGRGAATWLIVRPLRATGRGGRAVVRAVPRAGRALGCAAAWAWHTLIAGPARAVARVGQGLLTHALVRPARWTREHVLTPSWRTLTRGGIGLLRRAKTSSSWAWRTLVVRPAKGVAAVAKSGTRHLVVRPARWTRAHVFAPLGRACAWTGRTGLRGARSLTRTGQRTAAWTWRVLVVAPARGVARAARWTWHTLVVAAARGITRAAVWVWERFVAAAKAVAHGVATLIEHAIVRPTRWTWAHALVPLGHGVRRAGHAGMAALRWLVRAGKDALVWAWRTLVVAPSRGAARGAKAFVKHGLVRPGRWARGHALAPLGRAAVWAGQQTGRGLTWAGRTFVRAPLQAVASLATRGWSGLRWMWQHPVRQVGRALVWAGSQLVARPAQWLWHGSWEMAGRAAHALGWLLQAAGRAIVWFFRHLFSVLVAAWRGAKAVARFGRRTLGAVLATLADVWYRLADATAPLRARLRAGGRRVQATSVRIGARVMHIVRRAGVVRRRVFAGARARTSAMARRVRASSERAGARAALSVRQVRASSQRIGVRVRGVLSRR